MAPLSGIGDPSQTLSTPLAQHRTEYVFLAPDDYDVNFVNFVSPTETDVWLDGEALPAASFSEIGGSGIAVARVRLTPIGVHRLEASHPIGIQVYGYGRFTSYQYPGGLDLERVAQPPLF